MRRLRTMLVWLIGAGFIVTIAGAIYFRAVSDDPTVWHVDPAVAERTGRPNDFLVAPEGATQAQPDQASSTYNVAPRELMFLLDAVAGQSSATSVLAGSLDDLWITYVQRTAVAGFPDYISVKAVETDGGAALIIWSRSRFGHSDFGVNRKRVQAWLAQIGNGKAE